MNDNILKFIAGKNTTIVEAMRLIDSNTEGIVFITDDEERLVGSLTDGDIRRWIISTGEITSCVSSAMNQNPKTVFEKDTENAADIMKTLRIYAVPVINNERKIIDIIFSEYKTKNKIDPAALEQTPVIIMAGGRGTRLYPFTKILPKPLIPIGDLPIIERIINKFNDYGTKDFYLTVNYKKEMIKAYFAETIHDYNITYVEEDKPLGTAGSIRLITKKFDTSVIITNCDVLIEADYGNIMQYHKESGNAVTIISSLKNTTIPYGVLHTSDNGTIVSMEEKPQLSCFINTGMYVLEPQFIERIPDNSFYHMPQLAEQLIKDGLKVGMYPVSEDSFLDMGEFEEMKRMENKIAGGEIK